MPAAVLGGPAAEEPAVPAGATWLACAYVAPDAGAAGCSSTSATQVSTTSLQELRTKVYSTSLLMDILHLEGDVVVLSVLGGGWKGEWAGCGRLRQRLQTQAQNTAPGFRNTIGCTHACSQARAAFASSLIDLAAHCGDYTIVEGITPHTPHDAQSMSKWAALT